MHFCKHDGDYFEMLESIKHGGRRQSEQRAVPSDTPEARKHFLAVSSNRVSKWLLVLWHQPLLSCSGIPSLEILASDGAYCQGMWK